MYPPLFPRCLAVSLLALFSICDVDAAVFDIPNGDIAALKNAINIANTNGEDDVIRLAPNGTYTLTTIDNNNGFFGGNGLPVIGADAGHSVTINANGAVLERSAASGTPFFRILYIAPDASIALDRIIIRNGVVDRTSYRDAGAVYNDHGSLTLTNSDISHNVAYGAGAIMNRGDFGNATLVVTNCIFNGNSAANAGAIGSWTQEGTATLIVRDSTFSENYADYEYGGGGAIYLLADNEHQTEHGHATASIENCTFRQNAAPNGGAIHNLSEYWAHLDLVISNCTFDTNSANDNGGAIYNNNYGAWTNCDIRICTFNNNFALVGIALYNNDWATVEPGFLHVELRNNIFQTWTDRHNIDNYDINNGPVVVTSLGYNLTNDDGSGLLNAPGDQINADAMLDPAGLQNNGGPTQTVALLPDSPAIDAGDPEAAERDQRYYLRSGAPDIGAFEAGGILAPRSAVSRKTHGAAGSFDVDLPLSGNSGTECRGGGVNGDHEIVLSFATPVTVKDATITAGIGSVGSAEIDGTDVIVDLTGVANAQQLVLTLSGVSDGINTNDTSIPMRVLLGDTTGNGVVNASDVSQTKGQLGQSVTALNFRADVTANGAIDSSDVSVVKSQVGGLGP